MRSNRFMKAGDVMTLAVTGLGGQRPVVTSACVQGLASTVDGAEAMVEITGATRLYAIVGDPIAQAKSPAVYNAMLSAAGTDSILVPWRLSAGDFAEGMRGLQCAQNVDGLVITYPHKQSALALADSVRPRARQVGACNALRRMPDGGWEADMFDGVGLVHALEQEGGSVRGRSVWLVGAGGAGCAIGFALAEAGCRTLHVTDVHEPKAEQLVAAVSTAWPSTRVVVGRPDLGEIEILVHATPAGLADDDPLPVAGLESLKPTVLVSDIVPRERTPLLALAQARGCRTVQGAAMVTGQARAVLDFFAGAG